MSFSPEDIDRIVANVLTQISSPARPVSVASQPQRTTSPSTSPAPATRLPVQNEVVIRESVITADLLEQVPAGSDIRILPKAIVTPAARDVVKGRKLRLHREAGAKKSVEGTAQTASSPSKNLLIVVQNTAAVDQLYSGLTGSWQRELVGCPDDAAKLVIAEISRGGASTVVILAEQTYRAAALANRNQAVKAVAIHDASEIRLVRQQLRANTWCISPAGRTFFELRNLIQRIRPES